MDLRVGLIGFGYWGPNLARNLGEIRGVTLAAVADRSSARREAAGARHPGTFLFDDPLELIARPGSVVWANPGKPLTLCTSHCGQEIIEAIVKALAPACPERAMAGWGRRFRIAIQGKDPRAPGPDGRPGSAGAGGVGARTTAITPP